MKTITTILIETPEDFIQVIRKVRSASDDSPRIPSTVYLVVEHGCISLSGEGAEGFELGPKVTQDNLLKAALVELGLSRVHFT